MRLRWDARAIQDLHDIRSYISARSSPAAANRVRQNLHARADRLRVHPCIGVDTRKTELRILQPTRYPYRIYYMVQGDEIVILHIRHTARGAPDDLKT